ncbi:hypothetical protein FN846DRAFT_950865, partial [Sphaerosporella brunnea]
RVQMHTSSESHIRQMLLVGEDPKSSSSSTAHSSSGLLDAAPDESRRKENRCECFYQEYIANKEHVHMKLTKGSRERVTKHLGREGIVEFEEGEERRSRSGIDNSPDA